MKQYFFNVALGLDLLTSAILGGLPGETLSGRAGSAYQQGKLRGKIFAPIIDFIMRKKGHCVAAIKGDVLRAQAVIVDQGGKAVVLALVPPQPQATPGTATSQQALD